MTPDTLHSRLRSVIEERLKVARIRAKNATTSTAHAAYDPSDAIRRYEYAIKVLDRHAPDTPTGAFIGCSRCVAMDGGSDSWPCAEIVDLAESLGIEP